jgi:hypothetical protein
LVQVRLKHKLSIVAYNRKLQIINKLGVLEADKSKIGREILDIIEIGSERYSYVSQRYRYACVALNAKKKELSDIFELAKKLDAIETASLL